MEKKNDIFQYFIVLLIIFCHSLIGFAQMDKGAWLVESEGQWQYQREVGTPIANYSTIYDIQLFHFIRDDWALGSELSLDYKDAGSRFLQIKQLRSDFGIHARHYFVDEKPFFVQFGTLIRYLSGGHLELFSSRVEERTLWGRGYMAQVGGTLFVKNQIPIDVRFAYRNITQDPLEGTSPIRAGWHLSIQSGIYFEPKNRLLRLSAKALAPGTILMNGGARVEFNPDRPNMGVFHATLGAFLSSTWATGIHIDFFDFNFQDFNPSTIKKGTSVELFVRRYKHFTPSMKLFWNASLTLTGNIGSNSKQQDYQLGYGGNIFLNQHSALECLWRLGLRQQIRSNTPFGRENLYVQTFRVSLLHFIY